MQKTTDWNWRMEITYWERAQELISGPQQKSFVPCLPVGMASSGGAFFVSQKYSNRIFSPKSDIGVGFISY